MNTHTKGPWLAGAPVVYSDEDGEETIYQITVYSPAPREFGVAELVGPKAEIVPNARLIAAAPDLLEALERLMACGVTTKRGRDEFHRAATSARAAIHALEIATWDVGNRAAAALAKAKGEA